MESDLKAISSMDAESPARAHLVDVLLQTDNPDNRCQFYRVTVRFALAKYLLGDSIDIRFGLTANG